MYTSDRISDSARSIASIKGENVSKSFLLSYGERDTEGCGVCIVQKSDSEETVQIVHKSSISLRYPLHLAMDKNGRVLLVDHGNARLFLFDQQLENVQDLYEWRWSFSKVARGPGRLCLVNLPCVKCTRLLVGLGKGPDNPKNAGAVDIFDYMSGNECADVRYDKYDLFKQLNHPGAS